MGTTKSGEENVRIVSKSNTGTYTVSLPIGVVRKLGWRAGQKVVITENRGSIVINDRKK